MMSIMYLQIYMQYPFARKVESVIKKSAFEGRGFGAKMTVEQLIAKQTRIERYFSRNFLLNDTQLILVLVALSTKQYPVVEGTFWHMHCICIVQLSTSCQVIHGSLNKFM